MLWSELYGKEHEPSGDQVKEFVGTPLWDDLADFMVQTHKVQPKLSHSSCAMDGGYWKGWNVKYKKSGKSLCTLYPKQGYILALMPVGLRETNEAELLMPSCTQYTRTLFEQAESGHIGKFLAMEIKSADVLDDLKKLIALRATKRPA
ncbi:MAG: DUF3788 domain-containing protein [Oscillospiraceae bacterium]|nr:DUF3788 domain-containing protein [Oscillospiraceae bacterium]